MKAKFYKLCQNILDNAYQINYMKSEDDGSWFIWEARTRQDNSIAVLTLSENRKFFDVTCIEMSRNGLSTGANTYSSDKELEVFFVAVEKMGLKDLLDG